MYLIFYEKAEEEEEEVSQERVNERELRSCWSKQGSVWREDFSADNNPSCTPNLAGTKLADITSALHVSMQRCV